MWWDSGDCSMKINLNIRNRYILIGDLFLIVLSIVGSYILRLELIEVFSNYYLSLIWMLLLSLTLKPLIFYFFGLYRKMWVYASVRELKLIFIAVTVSSAVISAIMLVLFSSRIFTSFPRSILIIDWVVSILFVGGLRFGLRVLFENSKNKGINFPRIKRRKNVIIIGAGDMGETVVREFLKNPALNSKPIGFLDDNPEKINQQLHGIPVIGRVKDLSKIINQYDIDEAIIAIPSASGNSIRNITDICRKNQIPFRTMPGIYEIIGGDVSVTKLREVEISDLLRRQPADTSEDSAGEILHERIVLVTGAGGSIGQELCRQIARYGPKKIILLGHGENSIFESSQEIKEAYPNLDIVIAVADIRDEFRINQVYARHQPQVVFHAAAHKHVPIMETHVEECVLNNIGGTNNIVNHCVKYDVERLILISTDKAIRPVSVMGATKRVAEMLVLDAAKKTNKPYTVVRFGNVLGSRGSVVPLFKRQIANGGPVTITHPDMRRYFMTIPEAVYLVLQAAGMGTGGETYVLDMGEQVRIVDLAEDLIRLSGFEPRKDVEIIFTGIRNGEKLSEDLWNEGRTLYDTDHPGISSEEGQEVLVGDRLQSAITKLLDLSRVGNGHEIIRFFNEIIPDAEIRPILETEKK